MDRDNQGFERSLQLFRALGETVLRSGQSLRAELCLGDQVSLWDITGPYLSLYRFPLLTQRESIHLSWRERSKSHLWPFRSLVARYCKDIVVSTRRKSTAACDEWPSGESTVLFLGISPTFYREVLLPVVEWLIKESQLRVAVLGLSSIPPPGACTGDRVMYQSIWAHWDDGTKRRTQGMFANLQPIQAAVLDRTQMADLVSSSNSGIKGPVLRREFKGFFWRECRRLIPQIALAEHILKEHRPLLIVSADDADQRCRIYPALGQRRGIPSLIVQQGIVRKNYPEWTFFSTSAISAMGAASRTEMVAQGVPPNRISLTGHPGFDRLVAQEPEACARIRADLGVAPGHRMVLFASQPYYIGAFKTPEIRREMINAIVKALTSLENVRLIVKPHPAERPRELRRLVASNSRAVVVERTMDISLLIKACDVLITFFSQVALQALIAEKPVINVVFPESGGAALYEESGATCIARSTDEILTHVRKLIGETREEEIAKREDARASFIYEWAYLPDGNAARRVGQLILEMLKQR